MPSLPRPAGPVPIARAGRVHSEPPDRNRRYIQDLAIWRRDPRLAHAGGMRVLKGRTKDTLSLPSLPLLADGRSAEGVAPAVLGLGRCYPMGRARVRRRNPRQTSRTGKAGLLPKASGARTSGGWR